MQMSSIRLDIIETENVGMPQRLEYVSDRGPTGLIPNIHLDRLLGRDRHYIEDCQQGENRQQLLGSATADGVACNNFLHYSLLVESITAGKPMA